MPREEFLTDRKVRVRHQLDCLPHCVSHIDGRADSILIDEVSELIEDLNLRRVCCCFVVKTHLWNNFVMMGFVWIRSFSLFNFETIMWSIVIDTITLHVKLFTFGKHHF